MKNRMVLFLTVVFVFAAGCGGNAVSVENGVGSVNTEQAEPGEVVDDADNTESDNIESDNTEESVSGVYQVEMVTLLKDDLRNINYPRISGWSNLQKQQEWNAYFEEVATNVTKGMEENDRVTLLFQVETQNEEMLSLTYEAEYEYAQAAHPSADMKSYNIDMKTGERLTFSDMADPAKTASTLFGPDGYRVLSKPSMREILEYNFIWMEPTEESLANSLANFDKDFEEYGDNETMGHSFVRDGKLVLIFFVNHAMGDYAVVELES